MKSLEAVVSTSVSVVFEARQPGGSGHDANIRNTGNVSVYIGGPDVSTANGYPLEPQEAVAFTFGAFDRVYAVVETGTSTLRILDVRP